MTSKNKVYEYPCYITRLHPCYITRLHPCYLTLHKTNFGVVIRMNHHAAYYVVRQRCPTSGDGQSSENVQRSRVSCLIDRSTLTPSSLASVKVEYRKIAVGQVVKVPSPAIFGVHSSSDVKDERNMAKKSGRSYAIL